MKDERLQIFVERIDALSIEQIKRIKDNVNIICFDTFNYDESNKTFCPLAVALNLHETVENPTNESIGKEIGKHFIPVNALKNVKGKFYTNNRREDLLKMCDIMIKEKTDEANEKMNIYVSEDVQKKWPRYYFKGKPFQMSDGRTYIRAHCNVLGKTHYYDFEKDWFWHDINSIPLPVDKSKTTDII